MAEGLSNSNAYRGAWKLMWAAIKEYYLNKDAWRYAVVINVTFGLFFFAYMGVRQVASGKPPPPLQLFSGK